MCRKNADSEAVDLDGIPDVVKKELDEIKMSGGYKAVRAGNTFYLIAASGERPTGGYSIKIYSARSSETGSTDVFTLVHSPRPGDMVTQAVTYPYDIRVIKPSEDVSRIRFLDNKGNVLKVVEF